MGFNDYSKKQNDQLPEGVNLVAEKQKRIESALRTKLEPIYDFGDKKELCVWVIAIDFENREVHLKLKYCDEYWEWLKFEDEERHNDSSLRLIKRCEQWESEIQAFAKAVVRSEDLPLWRVSLSQA